MNSNHCSSLEVRGEPLCWACSSGQRLDAKEFTLPRGPADCRSVQLQKTSVPPAQATEQNGQEESTGGRHKRTNHNAHARQRKVEKKQAQEQMEEKNQQLTGKGKKTEQQNMKEQSGLQCNYVFSPGKNSNRGSAILRLQGIPLRKSRSEKQHPEKQEEISLLVAFFPGVEIFLRNCPQRDLPLQLIAYN
ncbi:uncharacterized protein LOC125753982 isoform X2 [Canis lupus dingo]|uniref:uncharacterized protein LOC125753982 isoform X2 n=1 Tax=Canis lupus dingo TaxID=286419 RepID=UPI0020C2BF20|nr:uncharacterized protein LOC125753982 isoform X2 [Canis lupus dingo]